MVHLATVSILKHLKAVTFPHAIIKPKAILFYD